MDQEYGPNAVGITSTVPIEIIFAAGARPVDLNNRFVTDRDRTRLVEQAEAAGFPRNFCAWIKGIYALARRGGIRRIVGVRQGDCSNTHLLLEIFEEEGIEVLPFEYPPDGDAGRLRRSMVALAERLDTTLEAAESVRREMQPLRRKLEEIDRMTWQDGGVTGFENHLWLINSSDMRADWRVYEREVDEFLTEAAGRGPRETAFRLGFVGIPPIADDIYEHLAARGAGVVFNEFQRQFSMPGMHEALVGQYLAYTYPYRTSRRVADIEREVAARRIDGLVHYVQSFCYRQLQDRAIRRAAGVPVLTLEFDRPGKVDTRSVTRLEAFIEVLAERRAIKGGPLRGGA